MFRGITVNLIRHSSIKLKCCKVQRTGTFLMMQRRNPFKKQMKSIFRKLLIHTRITVFLSLLRQVIQLTIIHYQMRNKLLTLSMSILNLLTELTKTITMHQNKRFNSSLYLMDFLRMLFSTKMIKIKCLI